MIITYCLQLVLKTALSAYIQAFFIMPEIDLNLCATMLSPHLYAFCLINTRLSFLLACMVFNKMLPFTSGKKL